MMLASCQNQKQNIEQLLGPTWGSPSAPLRDDVGKLPTST
jgi:hypothetical protein